MTLDNTNLRACTVDGCTFADVHYHGVLGGVHPCTCGTQAGHVLSPCVLPRVLTVPIEDVRVGDTVIIAPDTSFEVGSLERHSIDAVYVFGRDDAVLVLPMLALPAGSLVLVRRSPDAPILDRLAKAADDPRTLLAAMRAAGLTVEVAS